MPGVLPTRRARADSRWAHPRLPSERSDSVGTRYQLISELMSLRIPLSTLSSAAYDRPRMAGARAVASFLYDSFIRSPCRFIPALSRASLCARPGQGCKLM